MFQSTHPHRVRHACKGSILFPYLCFNPRTHTGCDVSLAAPQFLNRRFQSTHPHGVRLAESCVCHHQQGFQSTHPHGVRPARRIDARGKGRFNPRTHTGCDQRAHRKTIAPIIVSIHAPTRGATHQFSSTQKVTIVSIHAPTRGATQAGGLVFCVGAVSIHAPTRGATAFAPRYTTQQRFQSTHPHGVRHRPPRRKHKQCYVSIHAPTRGATSLTVKPKAFIKFQSTHPHGVRLALVISCALLVKFQSTHPHGVRLFSENDFSLMPCFNPRTHTGCDVVNSKAYE